MPIYRYQHDGRAYSVEIAPDPADPNVYNVTIDGRAIGVDAAMMDSEAIRMAFADDTRALAVVAADGDARHVWIDGAQLILERIADAGRETTTRGSRAASRGVDKRVTAPMPGQVRAVAVQIGDSVTAGQTLVVLEAMKMELRAAAPADGVIARVMVQVGEVVERGALLVELE
jgi:biotin carboxyl carrier protein